MAKNGIIKNYSENTKHLPNVGNKIIDKHKFGALSTINLIMQQHRNVFCHKNRQNYD